MADILVTVSGTISPDIEQQAALGLRPLPDYLAMARGFPADVIDYAVARQTTRWFGRVLERVGGPNLTLAWACFLRRRQYRVIFTDGEQVGIPLAILCKGFMSKGFRHVMLVHILSTKMKSTIFDLFGLHKWIDTFCVYASWQQRFIERRWHITSDRVQFTHFMVDANFYALRRVVPHRKRMICAVGLEYRDYPTLIEAVRGLDVEVVIAAASPWSKRKDTSSNVELPPNVQVRRFSQMELRQLYADSLFMVMPLYDVPFQAGVTAILEAMAMERAVICSRTRGQTDVIVDGETGLYVEPGNVMELRAAISQLLADPDRADRLGCAGHTCVMEHMQLDVYVERLNSIVGQTLEEHEPRSIQRPARAVTAFPPSSDTVHR